MPLGSYPGSPSFPYVAGVNHGHLPPPSANSPTLRATLLPNGRVPASLLLLAAHSLLLPAARPQANRSSGTDTSSGPQEPSPLYYVYPAAKPQALTRSNGWPAAGNAADARSRIVRPPRRTVRFEKLSMARADSRGSMTYPCLMPPRR